MSDVTPHAAAEPARATTAGALLRQARQARGVHIAALAAVLKVVPHKLELLESDRFDELPDATFARALAQGVCRVLKIDAVPILALLPPLGGHRLEHVAQGLKTPYRGNQSGTKSTARESVASPALWIAGMLVIGALVMYVLPTRWLPFTQQNVASVPPEVPDGAAAPATVLTPAIAAAPKPPASEPVEATKARQTVAEVASAPAVSPVLGAAGVTKPEKGAAGPAVKVNAKARSWVQIVDTNGQVLIARVLEAGETVAFDAATPLKLTIGNVSATDVIFRGEPVALASYARGNVARLDLK